MNYLFIRNWIGFFILGSINNLSYVIVNSSALVLAASFGKSNLVAVIPWANVGFNLIIKGINTFLLVKVPMHLRFGVNGVLMIIGLLGISFSPNFYMIIAFILVIGLASGLGESIALEYLQRFDSRLVNAWSSGTGFAGVLGASLYIVFTCIVYEATLNDISVNTTERLRRMNQIAFWASTPLPIAYLIAYFIIIKREPEPEPELDYEPQEVETESKDTSSEKEDESIVQLLDDDIRASNIQQQPLIGKKPSRVKSYINSYLRGFTSTLWLSLNLTAVYYFEYLVRTYSSKTRPKYDFHPACPELYAAIQLSYQAGVFVSRSSLQIIKIRYVWILTILQGINMAVWLIDDFWKFLPIYVLPVFMVYVGLLGGASYVNIFYLVKTEDKFKCNREVSINICSMWIAVGIFTASATDTLFDLTFLKNY
ncbi:Battenin-like [Oopsacas minuta]|uniref:Battenin n=1 Tax=Oopsacas minuta TaxID=111878 RepID=A0AAV7KHS9_9METZ|nr:Battenin-like [Oopsacas minuta]